MAIAVSAIDPSDDVLVLPPREEAKVIEDNTTVALVTTVLAMRQRPIDSNAWLRRRKFNSANMTPCHVDRSITR